MVGEKKLLLNRFQRARKFRFLKKGKRRLYLQTREKFEYHS